MAFIKDIAGIMNLPVSLVDQVLSGKTDADEDIRRRIYDAALNHPNIDEVHPQSDSVKICVIVDDVAFETIETFGYDILVGFRLAAMRNRWNLDILALPLNEKIDYVYDEFMRQHGYSGAFLLGFFLHSDFHSQLKSTQYPTVLLDVPIYNPNVACVSIDNFQGITAVVEHLANLGHSTIAMLNGDYTSRSAQERFQGFRIGMSKCNLPIRKEIVAFGDYTSECAAPHVRHFIENGATAIVCGSDRIVMGVVEELKRLRVLIPAEVSVTGFDDMPFAKQMTPKLTTVRQNRLNLGKNACVALTQLLEGVSVSRIQLTPELIVRESTGPVR